ncbi:MAG: hypothetical protein ACK4PK_10965 [Alphaproteobacteria bacterium]
MPVLKSLFAIAAVFLLSACEPTVDASSVKNARASIEKMYDKMDEQQGAAFYDALILLTKDVTDKTNTGKAEEALYKKIAGMTAAEILDAAAEVRHAQKIKSLKRQLEIAEMSLAAHKLSLRKTPLAQELYEDIRPSNISLVEFPVFNAKPALMAFGRIQNDSALMLSEIDFDMSVLSPEGELWHETSGTFVFAAPGLRADDSAQLRLPVNIQHLEKTYAETSRGRVNFVIRKVYDSKGAAIGDFDTVAKLKASEKRIADLKREIEALTSNTAGAAAAATATAASLSLKKSKKGKKSRGSKTSDSEN